jgi:hypothetical protein
LSSDRSEGAGIPRRANRRVVVPPGSASRDETWHGANEAKTDKLRRNNLQRQARGRGLELRHSAYGYALVDKSGKRVENRNDMTLGDVESWLTQS